MAKVTVFSNVLDLSEKEIFDAITGETIEQFLDREAFTGRTFDALCEVYDPETGETTYCAIEDNKDNPLKVSITVNGIIESPSYEIKETDSILIQIFPANSAGRVVEAVFGGLLVLGGILFAYWTAGASLTGVKAGLALLGVSLLVGGGSWLLWDALRDPKKNDKKNRELASDQVPTISGAQNQPLDGPFPLLIGRITATPYVVGSLYNDFVINDSNHATYFGTEQKATLLLAVAYAPIYIENIKFDSLIIASNKNHVLSGPLYHNFVEEGDKKWAENPWNPGNAITFNGKKSEYEIEPMWNSNKIKFEISQFGNHRVLYPITIKQSNVDEAVLYCYDNEYKEVADERTITWQGGSFPTGMRTNTIKFSESVPWKISVGIDFPQGLYRQHNTTEGGSVFTKIPMNLVIQWRPVYKYVRENNLDSLGNAEDVYSLTEEERQNSVYDAKRFYGWRNFTDVQVNGGPVNIISYTSKKQTVYNNYWYYENGIKKASKQGMSYGYFRSLYPDSNNGTYVSVQEGISANTIVNNLRAEYTYKYLTQTLSPEELEVLRNYSSKKGTSAYDLYLKGNPVLRQNIVVAKSGGGFTFGNAPYGVTGNTMSTSSVYGTSTQVSASGVYGGSSSNRNTVMITYQSYALQVLDNELPLQAKEAVNDLSRRAAEYYTGDDYWINVHKNTYQAGATETISERECALNKGLSENTSTDCNPTWHGVRAFSFGPASCGRRIWDETNKADPSIERSDITFTENDYTTELSHAESSMKFEISARLSQEDILDLLNCNPKSKISAMSDASLANLTDVVLDGVQVRVLRLTPCYIEKKDGEITYKYSDVVKWSYLKTYCVDKQKLLDDIGNLTETAEITDPATGKRKTVSYSKIDCNPATYSNREIHPDGATWLNWKIEDYYSHPVSDDDMRKLALLAVECEPDLLGRISNSISKINLTGYAITPTLLHNWTRYWYVINGEYYKCDYYDSSETRDLSLHPMWGKDDYMWIKTTYEDFNHKGVVLITGESYEGQYWYEEMDKDWQSQFFPNKVEPTRILQLETDDTGAPVRNDKGNLVTESIKQGNDWIPYIANFMSEHQDSAGRWIATEAFRNAFLNQNAIAQILGFMCGQSLGKDAYWYSSLNDKKFTRFWYRKEIDGDEAEYYYRDTDDVEFNQDRVILYNEEEPNNRYLWNVATPEDWNSAIKTDLGNGYSYSLRKPGTAFNMLALKEAYEYTDAIDVGGRFGPLSYKCNMYVTQQQKVVDLMSTILTCARAFWFYDELGRLEFHNDKPKKYPVLTISDENIISQTFSRSFAKGIAGYHGTFQDEDNDFQNGEIYVLRQGQSRESHTRDIIDTSITGITNSKQMWAMLAYMMGTNITQREVWNVNLNHVGNGLTIGSLVEMQTSTLEIGTDTSGRIGKLIEDDDYIYGFISDRTYEYRAEYKEDGTNVQGCSLLQPEAKSHSRIVTVRFASREQQRSGIHVKGSVFANLEGMTNLCLFEKRIVKAQERQEGQTEDSDTKTMRYTQFIPSDGDIVMFGNIGSITQKAVVYELQYDEKGKVSVGLYPYFDSLYTSGNTLPVYQTSMTKKARNDFVPVSMEVSRTELNKESMDLRSLTNDALNRVISGDASGITAPAAVTGVRAIARRDQIEISWIFNGKGLGNSIDSYTVVLTKKNGTKVTFSPSDTQCVYTFERFSKTGDVIDGYPEADDLEQWSVTVQPINIYGMLGPVSEPVYVNADSVYYGTWKVGVPAISPKVIDRTIILQLSPAPQSGARQVYGDIKYHVRLRRGKIEGFTSVKYWMHNTDNDEYWYLLSKDKMLKETVSIDEGTWIQGTAANFEDDEPSVFISGDDSDERHVYAWCMESQDIAADTEWLLPATTLDPYISSNNYYEPSELSQKNRFVTAYATYTQTMALYWTDGNESNYINTPYYFDVQAFNEAGTGAWYSGADNYGEGNSGVLVTALCTNFRDFVKANETVKEAYISELSAITANLGEISEGSLAGSLNNYWTLSTKHPSVTGRDYQGAFRVGGENQYFLVEPIIENGEVKDYSISLKAQNISFTSSGVDLNDVAFDTGTYIYDDNDKSIRLFLTAKGIEIQKKIDNTKDWSPSNVSKEGVIQLTVNSVNGNNYSSFIISNSANEVKYGISVDDIEAYHFDKNVLDENNVDSHLLKLEITDLTEQGGLVSNGYYNGIIKAEQANQTVILTKTNAILVNGYMILENGNIVESLAERMNQNSTTNWGLTTAQISGRIFHPEE